MNQRFGSVGMTLLGLFLALLPARALLAAGFSYKEVARLGMKAPGGGKLVNDFEPGAISGQGEVAFVVDYDPPGDSSEGLYLASGGSLIAVVEPGKAAVPNWTFTPQGPLGMLSSPVGMNAAGDLSFGSDVLKKGESTIVVGNFLWQRAANKIVAVHLPGMDAPGGGQFGDTKGHSWTSVNDQDDVAFSANVTDAAGNTAQGVFVRTADAKLHDIARPGDKSPDGSVFTQARRPNINNAGAVVFEGTVEKDDATGIYLAADGKITAVATPSTDAPSGGKFSGLQSPRLNNKGQVAFLGETSAGRGAYLMADGKLSAIVAAGSDLRDGAKLDQVNNEDGHQDGSLALSDAGDVALQLDLAANVGHAIYLWRGGQLLAVARAGMDLAGVGMVDDASGNHVALNNLGQVAFQAKLKDGNTVLVLATPVP